MKKLLLSALLALSFLPLHPVQAAPNEYILLEPEIIGQKADTSTDIMDYANLAFSIVLSLAVVLSVVQIVRGGLEYMASAIPGVKQAGLSKLKNSLLGLAIALMSFLVLRTINPNLVNWSLSLKKPSEVGEKKEENKNSSIPSIPTDGKSPYITP